MGPLENSKTWIPYINNKDCSKRICNLHCTQWCKYIILPSPPPPPVVFSGEGLGSTTVSPVVIALIGILASAFLLIVYYIVISRYCVGNNDSSASRIGVENQEILDFEIEMEDDDYNDQENNPTNYEPWYVSSKGLDEALINSIRVCKYKKGDGLVSCTDCSVCLGEFQEDESIRVLPKCTHAFHVYCIDTWLKNHSNCPLCRANVSGVKSVSIPVPMHAPETERLFEDNEFSSESRNRGRSFSRRVTSDLGIRDAIVHLREVGGEREVRRSSSMDSLCQIRVSIVDHEETELETCRFEGEGGSSKQDSEGNARVLNFGNLRNNVDIKRSFGSERYLWITKAMNGKNKEVLPL